MNILCAASNNHSDLNYLLKRGGLFDYINYIEKSLVILAKSVLTHGQHHNFVKLTNY